MAIHQQAGDKVGRDLLGWAAGQGFVKVLEVAARKDDAAATDQAARAEVAVSISSACDGG